MILKLDHLVISTADVEGCIEFYQKLGFSPKNVGNRNELFAGDFKINVHTIGKELSPHAQNVTPGSADMCFEISGSVEVFKKELEAIGLEIELGVVSRNGAKGIMNSFYLRDPDCNLVEFCSYEAV